MTRHRTIEDMRKTCERLEACLGASDFQKLMSSDFSSYGPRPESWQEKLLQKFAAETGITIATSNELLELIEVAKNKDMPLPPFDPGDPATIEKLQICERLEICVGVAWYQRFLATVEFNRARGQLFFWQEEYLRKFAQETGIEITTAEELVCLLDVAIARIIRFPPPPIDTSSGYSGWIFRPGPPPRRPDNISLKDWQELGDYHEEQTRKTEAVMRQARAWHEEALRLGDAAATARQQGDVQLAEQQFRDAFNLARRAADHCRNDCDPEMTGSEYHRRAALFALEAGDFQEAISLSYLPGPSLRGTGAETAKRHAEIIRQVDDISSRAEQVRDRLVGARLQEVIFPASGVFSPDSLYIACVVKETRVHFFDLASRELALEFEVPFAKEPLDDISRQRSIGAINFSADGKMMAFAGLDGSIVIWDRDAGKPRHALEGHRHYTYNVAFSPDGRRLASAGCFGMKLWDPIKGKSRGSFAHTVHNYCVAFSPDSKFVAWGQSEGGKLTLADVESKNQIYSFKAHRDTVRDLAFSPCGRILASASDDRTVKLLEADTGREIVSFINYHEGNRYLYCGSGSSVAFSPDGTLLATSGASQVLLWDLARRECIRAIPDTYPVSRVRFSPDGKWLAASSNKLRLWSVQHLLSQPKDLSSLKGKMGTVVVPANPRTALEQAVKPAPAPKKMPPPQHLHECTAAIKSKSSAKVFAAHVQCPCGNRKIRLLHTGATWNDASGESFPGDAKVGEGYHLVIKGRCSKCQAEHLLFDKDRHGWNGFVVGQQQDRVQPAFDLVPWVCACGNEVHTATINIASEGRQDAMDESGEFLTESNWQEGFSAIHMATTCCRCGHKASSWLSYETM